MSVDLEKLASEFMRRYGGPPSFISQAPGRVNLIGEHTDYNEGFVLPVAMDRTIAVAARPRDDSALKAYSVDYNQCDDFPVDRVRRFAGSRGWRDYVRAVAWALQDSQIELRGADIAIAGDVPREAGLSSSAALEVAVAGALTAVTGTALDPKKLALVCQKAENVFVGVQCGIMDQLASAMGIAGHALLIDCRSLETRPVRLPAGHSIVIVDSKVRRRLGNTAFNRRRLECAEAAAILGVSSLRDADTALLDVKRNALPEVLFKRARHVISENKRVLEMAKALDADGAELAGRLMFESHESLGDDFEVSTPELDRLVAVARSVDGVVGSRLTGAGFGGATVTLVRVNAVEALKAAVEGAGFEDAPEVIVCGAADGLRVTDA
jgi:galactokinase